MGTVWSTPKQVVGQGLAHIGRQREPVQSRPLAANQDLASMPIDVTKFQSSNLAGADPKSRQDRQDREVPDSNWRGAVTTRQEPHYVFGLKSPRQIAAPSG